MQLKYQTQEKKDFNKAVNKILKEFEISHSMDEIKDMKKSVSKSVVTGKCINASFEYLVKKAERRKRKDNLSNIPV